MHHAFRNFRKNDETFNGTPATISEVSECAQPISSFLQALMSSQPYQEPSSRASDDISQVQRRCNDSSSMKLRDFAKGIKR